MGNSLTLIQLPAQSGKTRKMTDLINKWNGTFNISGINDLNIIFTSNAKLLNKQTNKRIIRDVDNVAAGSGSDSDEYSVTETSDNPRTLSWTSSTLTRDGKKKMDVDNVFAIITSDDDDDEIDNIICCTNKPRMKHVMKLLEKLLKKFKKRNFNKEVNIWIDEADSSINIWGPYFDYISEMCSEKFVKNVVLITATMRPVYKYLHSIDVEPHLRTYENTHAPVYHKYSECELIHDISDRNKRVDDALIEVLTIHADSVVPGSKWFCPGNTKCASHENHCGILIEHGFNVLIINGQFKEFRLQNGDVVPIKEDLEEDLEVAKTLNRYYYDLELYNAPFAVTGKLCVSRGITFASRSEDGNEFLFTHGVIPDNTSSDDAYQMVMRCGGNIKEFSSYKKPIIFVSTKTSSLILTEERLAVEFAKKYWNGDEDQTVQITPGMLNESLGTCHTVQDIAGTVPKIIQLTEEEYKSIGKINRSWDESRVMELINEYDTELCMELMDLEKDQITEPRTENARKKQIEDLVSGFEQNKKKIISVGKEIRYKDIYQVFMDNIENRLIISRYYGSKLQK